MMLSGSPPVALDDSFDLSEDAPVQLASLFSPLGNDSDPENDALSIIVDNGPTNGTLDGPDQDGIYTYIPNPDFHGVDTFSYYAFDGSNNSASPATVTLTVSAVNDAPVNTPPSSFSVNEDEVLTLTGLSIADVDSDVAEVAVTLSVAHGGLTVSTTISGGVTSDQISGNDSCSVSIVASLSAINETLAAVNGLTYLSDAEYSGTELLTITTNDLGNTGYGGPQTDTDTVAITVRAVNDAPVNTIPDSQTVNEDSILSIAGLSISDIDVGTASVTVTLSVGSGILSIRSNVSVGVTAGQISGNGSGTVTITAPISMINATLANVSGVNYLGNPNFNGTDALTIQTNDRGNTGSGGPIVTNNELAIEVLSVDDPPVGQGQRTSKSCPEQDLLQLIGAPTSHLHPSANAHLLRVQPALE